MASQRNARMSTSIEIHTKLELCNKYSNHHKLVNALWTEFADVYSNCRKGEINTLPIIQQKARYFTDQMVKPEYLESNNDWHHTVPPTILTLSDATVE
jgi:hypothetical protein